MHASAHSAQFACAEAGIEMKECGLYGNACGSIELGAGVKDRAQTVAGHCRLAFGSAHCEQRPVQPNFTRSWTGSGPPGNWTSRTPTPLADCFQVSWL